MADSKMTSSAQTLSELSTTLGPERDGLIQCVAALQLVPENATKWMRFERLLEAVAGAPPNAAQVPVSAKRLRSLLTSPPIASERLLSAEDPFEESFVGSITFTGGSHRVVAGGVSGAHCGCQLLLDATRGLSESMSNLRSATFLDASLLLRLSEIICERAGLDRWQLPEFRPGTELVMPPAEMLEDLIKAVTFTGDEIENLFGDSTTVDHLVAPGVMSIRDDNHHSLTDDRLYIYPLTRLADGRIVVSLPSGIAACITHRALSKAVILGGAAQLVESLHDATHQRASTEVSRLRWQPVKRPSSLPLSTTFNESFYLFDLDKVAHVVSLVDDLGGYEAGKPFDQVKLPLFNDGFNARILAARRAMKATDPCGGGLHLVILTQLGRGHAFGISHDVYDEKFPILTIRLDEFATIASIERRDPLSLWKFASADNRLRKSTQVVSFSTLDTYDLYRTHGSGFYLSDDAPPNLLSISPGDGAPRGAETRQHLDRHGAVYPSGGVGEVQRWDADNTAPIFRPSYDDHDYLVELELPCWVRAAAQTPEEHEFSRTLAEAISFWLWQCRDLANPALTKIADSSTTICVDVEVRPQAPQHQDVSAVEPTSKWLAIGIDDDSPVISLTVLDGGVGRLTGPGNGGELAVAAVVLEAFYQCAAMSPPDLQHELAQRFPEGHMKMINAFVDPSDVMMRLGRIGEPRLLQDADVEVVNDRIGKIALSIVRPKAASIADKDRTKVINQIVAELVNMMKAELLEFEPGQLFERLVFEQESLIFGQSRTALLLPTQAACFGEDSSAFRDTERIRQKLVSSGPAHRFLLELGTAIGPAGDSSMSLADYDSLLALAKQVIELGYLSDAIQYGLSDTNLEMLASGRLGFSRTDPFHDAIASYRRDLNSEMLPQSKDFFARHWSTGQMAGPAFNPTELNEAYDAEFGITATELNELVAELMTLARAENKQVATWPRAELIEYLHSTTDISAVRVVAGLDLLSLSPLDSFPDPASPSDCYPWRFSRNRSAARRPITEHRLPDGTPVLTWGARSVFRAGSYLLDQILGGRVHPRSSEMQVLITAMRRDSNEGFNHQVAELYRSAGVPQVAENVKKINGSRLCRTNGEDIGDIDVLAIDPSKRVVLAVEVKDFELARTPFELSNEIAKLLDGPDSATHHHQERLQYLRKNLGALLAERDLPGPENRWQVQGLVITSTNLIGTHYGRSRKSVKKIRITSFAELSAIPEAELLVRTRPNPNTSRRKRQRRR